MRMNNLKIALIFVVSTLVIASCETNNSVAVDEVSEAISAEETVALVESDDISDEVDNIIDDFLIDDLSVSNKNEVSKTEGDNHGGMPDCVVKTVVNDGTSKTVTLDFGDGCELPNGHVLAGKIILSYIHDLEAETITITKSFDGFSFNEVTVEGENTIARIRENENGNPQSTKTIGVTITWPDGKTAERTGTRTREWVEGKETRTWGDNVFLITGYTTTTFNDGTVFNSEIIEPLRREMACRFIVRGVVEISKGDRQGTLDYGDGTCDNKATFTNLDNEVKEITLRKRKH